MGFSAPFIIRVDAGDPIVMLAGVHVGCFELFGTGRVRAIRDLKGKTVAVEGMNSSQHVFLASMMAYVGLDPNKDIHWVTHPRAEAIQLFEAGKIDAYLGFPPDPQHLRGKQVARAPHPRSRSGAAGAPMLAPGDVLVADRGLCSSAHQISTPEFP